MKKLNLETQILQVLKDNSNAGGSFMSSRDVANTMLSGVAVSKKALSEQTLSVKQRMWKVRELAEVNGYLVIPLRAKTKGDKTKKFRILGWKIATAGFDEQYIADELMYKIRNGEARTASFNRMINTAQIHGLLSSEKIKELSQ